jgi:hypothetical protein
MTTEWSHLPNAIHIDRILASLKTHPEQWSAEWSATWNAARGAAWDAARDTARDATRDTEWSAARDAAWSAAWSAARSAARDAILCLIAYDDCAYMIESEIGELKIIAAFGDEKAVLLLPACIALHSIKEVA